jgi:hypothetical protein
MKTFELLGKTVTIDTEKLSKGLHDLHAEDDNKATILAYGMLDAQLCELMEKGLKEAIIGQFEPITYDLFKLRIDEFIRDTTNEVINGVYKYAKMIV